MTADNSAPGPEYFKWFYEQGVWKGMHYRGVRILKFPCDLWNYQEIFAERGIQWVLETGTRHGGSALFFADLLGLNSAAGKVITIDVDPSANAVGAHPRIEFLLGNSASPDTIRLAESRLPGDRCPLFIILDSDHRREHVPGVATNRAADAPGRLSGR